MAKHDALTNRLLDIGKQAGGDGRVSLMVSVQYLTQQEKDAEQANPLSGGQAPTEVTISLEVDFPNTGAKSFYGQTVDEVLNAAKAYQDKIAA